MTRASAAASTPCRTPKPRSAGSSASPSSSPAAGAAGSPSVDKANVLATSRLWRTVAEEMRAEFPDVTLDHQLVDSCAMLLIRRPAALRRHRDREPVRRHPVRRGGACSPARSGMLPSASLGERRTAHGTFGLYEPIHGSAPDIAGRDIANPTGTILSAAMLLRCSLGRADAADADRGGGHDRPATRLSDGRPGDRRHPRRTARRIQVVGTRGDSPRPSGTDRDSPAGAPAEVRA